MNKLSLAGLTLVFGASTVLAAAAYPGHQLASKAKVTIAAAHTIALKAVPGKIVAEELENEKGASGLRYSFDIRLSGKTHEVGVDAITGKVLENAIEGSNPD
ncbi:MAG: PepSY domain-containing protein [Candidatus Eremiobacteraeota bacterium]|nr:PepSY domain-containing protein [Candidatus Eremiobacteraeota bacterium]